MTPRPCTWPDGGCGEPVLLFPTGRSNPDQTPIMQAVNPEPEQRVILLSNSLLTERVTGTQIMDTYVDHKQTCSAWAAKLERERAAGQTTKAGH